MTAIVLFLLFLLLAGCVEIIIMKRENYAVSYLTVPDIVVVLLLPCLGRPPSPPPRPPWSSSSSSRRRCRLCRRPRLVSESNNNDMIPMGKTVNGGELMRFDFPLSTVAVTDGAEDEPDSGMN